MLVFVFHYCAHSCVQIPAQALKKAKESGNEGYYEALARAKEDEKEGMAYKLMAGIRMNK